MAEKYLTFEQLFTPYNVTDGLIEATLEKAYKDRNKWKWDRDFVNKLSNNAVVSSDEEGILIKIAKSTVLKPEEKKFFFGFISPALKKQPAFLIELITKNNKAEKSRGLGEKLESIDIDKKYITSEVLSKLLTEGTDEFETYSKDIKPELFKEIILSDTNNIKRIAKENRNDPKFAKAIISILVNSDKIDKLPAVLKSDLDEDFKYCKLLLTDENYTDQLFKTIEKISHAKIDELDEEHNQKVNELAQPKDGKGPNRVGEYTSYLLVKNKFDTNKRALLFQEIEKLEKKNAELNKPFEEARTEFNRTKKILEEAGRSKKPLETERKTLLEKNKELSQSNKRKDKKQVKSNETRIAEIDDLIKGLDSQYNVVEVKALNEKSKKEMGRLGIAKAENENRIKVCKEEIEKLYKPLYDASEDFTTLYRESFEKMLAEHKKYDKVMDEIREIVKEAVKKIQLVKKEKEEKEKSEKVTAGKVAKAPKVRRVKLERENIKNELNDGYTNINDRANGLDPDERVNGR